MLTAALSMTVLGAGLGSALGFAARKFHVDTPPILEEINALMPGTNCGQCGLAGCQAAAAAIADGSAPISICPPGGRDLIEQLAELTGQEPGDLSSADDIVPQIAFVFEDHCTGCTKCFKRCPTDAIIGAAKQIHNVIPDACTGCNACVEVCPTEAIILRDKPKTLKSWYWHRPAQPGLESTL